MAIYTLLIREVDRKVFEAIRNGSKEIETRAAIEKYRKILKGDILNFVCGEDTLQKTVANVQIFDTISKLINEYDFKKIMPFVNSTEEMKEVYFSFPGYKEKIAKFGIIAFELNG